MGAIVSYGPAGRSGPQDLDIAGSSCTSEVFADRLLTRRLLDRDGPSCTRDRAPGTKAVDVAHVLEQHVRTRYEVELTAEEVGYLAMHVQRLLAGPLLDEASDGREPDLPAE